MMSDRESWSELHHLAYVYAAVASSDGSISNEELEIFCQRLHDWNPDIEREELMPIVMTAVSALGEDQGSVVQRQLALSVEIVAGALDEDGRAAALDDVLAIAGADGSLQPGEGELLLSIRDAWGPGPGELQARRHRQLRDRCDDG